MKVQPQYRNGNSNFSQFHKDDADHFATLDVLDKSIEALQKFREMVSRRDENEINSWYPLNYAVLVIVPSVEDDDGKMSRGIIGHPIALAASVHKHLDQFPGTSLILEHELKTNVPAVFIHPDGEEADKEFALKLPADLFEGSDAESHSALLGFLESPLSEQEPKKGESNG